jgi:hypothetical protein
MPTRHLDRTQDQDVCIIGCFIMVFVNLSRIAQRRWRIAGGQGRLRTGDSERPWLLDPGTRRAVRRWLQVIHHLNVNNRATSHITLLLNTADKGYKRAQQNKMAAPGDEMCGS